MNGTRTSLHARRESARGFTLLSVLVAIMIMGIGLLGMVRAMVGVTSASTQNQTVSSIASLSNGFWGTVQANPPLLVASAFSGTFNNANITSAPAELQPWLQQATTQMPAGQITIATGPNTSSGTACAIVSGCTVTLTMSWTQVGAPGAGAASQRSQVFYFAF